MRKLALLTIVLCTMGSTPAQAKSNSIAALVKCNSIRCAKLNIRHGKQLLRFLRTHRTAGTPKSRRAVHNSGVYLINYGRHQLRLAISKSRPAHYAGWICIHNKEASWTDDGAPYYGGLQMSEGWMGVVYHANLLSALQQMWLAENVAARYHFSYSWMRGQWPNTFPPCASYF